MDDALHEKMIFVHPGMVSKAGLVAPQIEKIIRFITNRLIDSILMDLIFVPYCDAPNPGDPVDHRQPAETCVSHIMRPRHE